MPSEHRLRRAAVFAVVLFALASSAMPEPARAASGQDKVLSFCVKNKLRCAISVAAVSERWERHLNPDRAQSLASTAKVLNLIAYAQAVSGGVLKANDTIHRDEWGRYQTLDGGALAHAWNRLGQPATTVELDDLATTMILDSDNAFPDWLLARLGTVAINKAKTSFPFHDTPQGFSAMFGLFNGAQGEGGAGNRLVADYGNFGVAAYQAEASAFFASLQNPAAVNQARLALCVQPPWIPGAPPCNPTQPFATEANRRTLQREFVPRSTSRTYLKVFKGLLEGNLVPAATQQVVRRHLESWFDIFPTLRPAFTRYGLKGGSYATNAGQDTLTWAHYMELSNKQRYVVVVFLQSLLETTGVPVAADVNAFAQQFALNPTFRNKVKKALAAKDSRPELLASIQSVQRSGNTVTLKARIDNISPNPTAGAFHAELRLANPANAANPQILVTVPVAKLLGNKGVDLTLSGIAASAPLGQLALFHADSKNAVTEQDETDNLTWSRVR